MSQQSHEREPEEDEQIVESTTHAAATTDDSSFDALLDEIDGVLEANAEEFVRSFVQKGGQ